MNKTHRNFDTASQVRFAQLSRDYNPIHVDAIAARRTQAGALTVHGIHSLLWLLEAIADSEPHPAGAASLKVQFRKPIYVGDECGIEVVKVTPETVRARIVIEGTETVVAAIRLGGLRGKAPPPLEDVGAASTVLPASPNNLRFDEMEGRSGCLSFCTTIGQTTGMFPSAARVFGARAIAALVCSSCLIGMVVPGLHSLLVGLEVSFSDEVAAPTDTLQFKVTSTEPRFRLIYIGVRGGGLYGSLEAVSQPPVMQQSMARVQTFVAKDEFRHSTALIIGGSRGLGELTAKLVAAGGGRVMITYATGKADAESVAEEIKKVGAECKTATYDIHQGSFQQLAALGERVPAHIYYFATPMIFRRKAYCFDLRRFCEFNSFYVGGFIDLVRACAQQRPEGVKVFYPSSVFIDTRPADMTEYADRKTHV